jgi:ATP-grasp domain-containing protein
MRTSVRPPEDCLGHAERLVAEIRLDGYSEIEFRRAVDGRPLLMEVNPRFSQSVELAMRSGVDFARMQVEWARGGNIPDAAAYRIGVRLSWFEAELFLVLASLLRTPRPAPSLPSTLINFARDYIPLPHLDGVVVGDPLPLLSQVRASFMEFRRQVRMGRLRESKVTRARAPRDETAEDEAVR